MRILLVTDLEGNIGFDVETQDGMQVGAGLLLLGKFTKSGLSMDCMLYPGGC